MGLLNPLLHAGLSWYACVVDFYIVWEHVLHSGGA